MTAPGASRGECAPVALVTGGARRLGAAISMHLGNKGYRVVINFRRSAEDARRLVRRIQERQGDAVALRADVTRQSHVDRMIERVVRRYTRIDVLVNNVGDYLEGPLGSMGQAEWEAMLRSNLFSVVLCTRAVLPVMRKQAYGRVVNIGYSPAGRMQASPRCIAYHIAKTGVLVYTKTVAAEEARHGITVNMVSPGTMFNSVKKPSRNPADYIPAGRFCRYDDLLGAIDYLLSDRASYVTGNHIVASGGYAL